MITRPSSEQLVGLVRLSLEGLPDRTSGEQKEILALADGLLGVVSRRAERDVAWMLEEIGQIEELARFLLFNGLDPEGTIVAKHALCMPADDVRPPEVAECYRRSSELLIACIPLAMNVGGETRAKLDAVISARVAHERGIRGDVAIVR